MIGLSIWDILAFIGFIFLIVFFYAGKNLVWTAFTIGMIAAAIVCCIYLIKGDSWPWELFKKIIVVITFIGIIVELLIRLSNKIRGKMLK